MIKTYKHTNGRIVARRGDGTFRNFTMREILGNSANEESHKLICGSCGYGQDEPWIPIMLCGTCPKCNNQENHKIREVPKSFRQKVIIAKIEKYKKLIGIDFIVPLAYREYGGKLSNLEYKLKIQINQDDYDSFGYPDLSERKFQNGQICINQYNKKIEILDTAGFDKINNEWVFRYKVCRVNRNNKRVRKSVSFLLETDIV